MVKRMAFWSGFLSQGHGESASPSAPPTDTREARRRREQLVAGIVRRTPIDPKVAAAMNRVPRHLFADASLADAYEDKVLRLGYGQTVSQPYVVAVMTHALLLTGTERVLEIGTGSGYQAAVLSLLGREVHSVEVIPRLAESARKRLAALGYTNVDVLCGDDGYAGWPERAPFDRVLLTAAPPVVPKALFDQLADGGVLVAPVGESGFTQELVRWRKQGSELTSEGLGSVQFVPMVHRFPADA
jgi:protein-L-isoaspartate(D-aspartate) O-methyltransferase